MTEQRERRFVVEYVRTAYPNDRALFNVKLGGIPSKFEGVNIGDISPNIFKSFNRYVDAVVFRQDHVLLIEAKILADLGAVSQLEYYGSIARQTPDLSIDANIPLKLQIVTASADPSFVSFANSRGIEVVVFTPDWAAHYLAQVLRG